MGDVTSTIGTTDRHYSTMQAWEDAKDGDLEAVTTRQIGECYDDTAFDEQITIDGSTTTSDYYMWLRAASGEEFDHTDSSGARNVSVAKSDGRSQITLKDNYHRLGGSEGASTGSIGTKFQTSFTGAGCIAIQVRHATNCPVSQIVVYETFGGSTTYGFVDTGTTSGIVVRNCLVYNLYHTSAGDAYPFSGPNTTYYNCVVYDVVSDGDDAYGFQGTVCYNCYAGNIGGGTGSGDKQSYINVTGDYNAADDTFSSIFTNNLQNKAGGDQFVSVAGGSEDFHLKTGADLIDAGNDGYSNEFDIDGAVAGTRDDMGIHEFVAVVVGNRRRRLLLAG